MSDEFEIDDPTVRHESLVEQAGFTMIPNAVLLNTTISLPARVLYGTLKHFAWSSKSQYAGQDRIAAVLGVTDRSVRTYLGELIEAKLILSERRGLGQTNRYIILPVPENFQSVGNPLAALSGNQPPESPGSQFPPNKEKTLQEEDKEIRPRTLGEIDDSFPPPAPSPDDRTNETLTDLKSENARELAALRKRLGL